MLTKEVTGEWLRNRLLTRGSGKWWPRWRRRRRRPCVDDSYDDGGDHDDNDDDLKRPG